MHARFRPLFVGTGLAAALVIGATPAFASVSSPTQVPDKPLASNSTCAALVAKEIAAIHSVNYPNAEVEPWIASTGGGHYIGAFQQDRWNDGGSNGLTLATSSNGTTWTLATSQPKFSICEGATPGSPGYHQRATDPWVTVAKDGTAYVISDTFDATGPGFGGPSTILISRSTDSGVNWSPPISVELDTGPGVLNDKESITADLSAGHTSNVYAVWDKLINPSLTANFEAFNHTFAYKGPAFLARSTDGGQTWSQGREIFDPGEFNQTIGNQIVVEPDGTLVNYFDLINNEHGPRGRQASTTFQVAVITSHDQGTTWSGPTIVGDIVDTPIHTLDGKAIRTGDILPEIAINQSTGTLYAAWQTAATIAFSQGTNDGATWSAPITISKSLSGVQAFTPSIGVSADGKVGVSYYDLFSATLASPDLTDTWFVSCSGSCSTNPSTNWHPVQLDTTGPFQMKKAPRTLSGYFVGDYESVAPNGTGGFENLWVMATTDSTNPTDAFSDKVS